MSDLAAFAVMFGVAAGTAAADQATKALVLGSHTATAELARPALLGIRATLNRNSVQAQMSRVEAPVIFGAATLTAIAVALLLGGLGAVGAGLAVGGVIGNGIDQRRHQATVDFLALRNGMVINLADIAIAVGTVLMIAAFLQS